MKEQLIFVYNAKSDLLSMATDFARKIFSPSSYHCRLCALGYGNFSIKSEWKSFIEALPVETVFYHKDEFERQYRIKASLPAVFALANETITPFITKQEIEACQSLEELKDLVTEKIKEHVQHHHPNIQ